MMKIQNVDLHDDPIAHRSETYCRLKVAIPTDHVECKDEGKIQTI